MSKRQQKSGQSVDPALPQKKRARRRVIGAVALLLVAAVVLSIVLDHEPRTSAPELVLSIPPKDSALDRQVAGRVTGANGERTAAAASPPGATGTVGPATAAAPPVASPREGGESSSPPRAAAPAPSAGASASTPASASAPDPAPASAPASARASAPAAAPRPESARTDASGGGSSRTEPARAEAPRTEPSRPAQAAPGAADDPIARIVAQRTGEPVAAAKDGSFVLQAGAFRTEKAANAVMDSLRAAGYKPFTQIVPTVQGDVIRVRLGPFESREAAEKARQQLEARGIKSQVLPS